MAQRKLSSHGTGLGPWNFARRGDNVVIEHGALVFHPENIRIGSNVYVGHHAILKGYYRNAMIIGDGSWIGQQAFLHSAGGIRIGEHVGVGPGVRIISSRHRLPALEIPIFHGELEFAEVVIGDGCDLGVNSVILPGVELGAGCQVGAGAVVAASFEPGSVVAGVPARCLRTRS